MTEASTSTSTGASSLTPHRDRTERDLLVLLVVVATLLAFRPIVDPDLPGHLAYGLVHYETGALQTTDPYSYTVPGAPWVNHEWAFEWLIAALYTLAGVAGLQALQGVAWTVTGVLVVLLVRRGTTDFTPAAALFATYVALAFPSISVRPQLMTFLAFALLVTLLEAARRGRLLPLLGLPPLMAAWTNLHGGFLAGVGVLGAFTAGLVLDGLLRRPLHGPRGDEAVPRRTAAWVVVAAVAAGLATLANPYGPGLHLWLLESLGVPNPNISEWRPIELDERGVTFIVAVLLTGAALLAYGPRRVPLAHALPLAATAVLAFKHTRHVPFFMVLACAAAAGPLAALFRRAVPRPEGDLTETQQRRMGGFAVAVGLLAAVWRLGLSDVKLRLSPDGVVEWPTAAIEHVDGLLKARPADAPPVKLLVHFDWAQLAIWRWHPLVRVHYDGRHRTVFPLAIEHEHFAFLGLDAPAGSDAPRSADLVLTKTGDPADRRMRKEPGWRLAYVDPMAALFERGDPARPPVVGPERPAPIAFETRLGR